MQQDRERNPVDMKTFQVFNIFDGFIFRPPLRYDTVATVAPIIGEYVGGGSQPKAFMRSILQSPRL